jgi:alpha-L-fucosidase 2
MPSRWPEAVFHNLRTEGAFLVSAARQGGKTQWIRIESLANEPLVLQTDMLQFKAVGALSPTLKLLKGPRS